MTVFSAFFSALILHFLIFLSKFKSITDAISHLEEIIYKRTGAGSIKIDSIYASSLESSPADVLHNYINMPVLFDPVSPPLLSVFRIWHLLLLVVIGWIWRTVFSSTFMASRTELAIGASWAVSIMGPIGWFLLARPHSAGHTHIDFTLWYFYTIPMSFALCVRRIPRFRRTYYNLKPLIGFLIAIICVVGAMYGLSLYLVT
jgi:hypothetical protein